MSKLTHANALLRARKYKEAFDIFCILRNEQPSFLPYEQGFQVSLKHIKDQGLNSAVSDAIFLSEVIHPKSKSIDFDSSPLFVVITPVLNGEKFIRITLDSVLNQSGNFFIDYLIKDAVSTDSTLAILLDYRNRIQAGDLPLRCNGIRFRIKSLPDNGLYDAISYGFNQAQQRNSSKNIYTYINADDVFADHAFSITAHVMLVSDASWIVGQPHIINEDGKLISTPQFPLSYAKEDIRAGLHDGISLYFIQQEGSFWSRELYEKVGGINSSLKLAGDFDLWRRFSEYVELLVLDCPLASFRSHATQLSKQMDKYYAEVNQVRPKSEDNLNCNDSYGAKESLQFFLGFKAPAIGIKQRQGSVCFLNDSNEICEIAYIKRGWVNW